MSPKRALVTIGLLLTGALLVVASLVLGSESARDAASREIHAALPRSSQSSGTTPPAIDVPDAAAPGERAPTALVPRDGNRQVCATDLAGAARVHGRVIDRQGQPPQVLLIDMLRLEDNATGALTIDATTGAFEGPPVAPGDYRLRVYADSEQAFSVDVPALAANEDRDLGTIVPPAKGCIHVRLELPEGVMLESVDVKLGEEHRRGVRSLSRDVDNLRFPWMYVGDYELLVHGDDIVSLRQRVVIEDGIERTLTVSPVVGVRVNLQTRLPVGHDAWGVLDVTFTDGSGVVLASHRLDLSVLPWEPVVVSEVLPAGRCTVTARADERLVASFTFDVPVPPAPYQEHWLELVP